MKPIKDYFHELRMGPAHHLGMGDIRLTVAMQEEIEREFDRLEFLHSLDHNLADRWQEDNERMRKFITDVIKLADTIHSHRTMELQVDLLYRIKHYKLKEMAKGGD